MKNFALIVFSAALTVVVWIVIGGLIAEPPLADSTPGEKPIPSEKPTASEVEQRKQLAEIKEGLQNLSDRVEGVEKNYEMLRLAKEEQNDQPPNQVESDQPRITVVDENVIRKLDRAFSDLNVQLKKVKDRRAQVRADLKRIRKSLYTSEAKLALMNDKRVASEAAVAKAQGQVEKLAEMIDAAESSGDGTLDINGRSYTVEQLKEKAKAVSHSFDQATTRLRRLEQVEGVYTESILSLESREDEIADLLWGLDAQNEVVQTKRESLESLRADLMLDGSNPSLNRKVAKIVDDIELEFMSDDEFEMKRAKFDSDVEIIFDQIDLDSKSKKPNKILNAE